MDQLPVQASSRKQIKNSPSYRTGWILTIIASVIILAAIAVVATLDGLRIAAQEQARKITRANIQARQDVYPGPVYASPTIVIAPQPAQEEISPDSALVPPTRVAVPEPEVEGLIVTVNAQKDTPSLRSGPGIHYASQKELSSGEKLKLLTKPIDIDGQQWQMVKTQDGHIGWCQTHWLSSGNGGE